MNRTTVFNPSSTPTSTWVESSLCTEYIGAQVIVENQESITTCRLTTRKTRKSFVSVFEPLLPSPVKWKHMNAFRNEILERNTFMRHLYCGLGSIDPVQLASFHIGA